MADELAIQLYVQYTNSPSFGVLVNPDQFNMDVAGTNYVHRIQNIDTSAENLDKGEITTPGLLIVHNLDSANFCELGYDDTGFKNFLKVIALKWQFVYLAQATPQAKFDTGAGDLEYWMFEA